MYKPLPDYITIKESPINGLGLFATEKIKAHSLIGVTHHPRKESEDGYIRTPLGGFGNHSDDPNCSKLLMEKVVIGGLVHQKTLSQEKNSLGHIPYMKLKKLDN